MGWWHQTQGKMDQGSARVEFSYSLSLSFFLSLSIFLSLKKKNPWWKPFFQWTEESIDFPSMVRCSSWILMGKLNLIFSKRKKHFFIEIGWELKKLKSPYWEWIVVESRQLHLNFFLLNLLSLEHF